MSSQAVGHSLSSRPILLPAEPRSQSTLPSPVSRTVASVVTGDGTQWIFYYNAQSIISYQKITANGKSTRSQLNVESKPVVGGPNDSLAVTLIEDTVSRVLCILLRSKIQNAKYVGPCFFLSGVK